MVCYSLCVRMSNDLKMERIPGKDLAHGNYIISNNSIVIIIIVVLVMKFLPVSKYGVA